MSKYDVNAIRQRLQKTLSGRQSDPDQFKPKKADDGQTIKYRFYVLPPLSKGDKVKGGTATRDMEQFFVKHGQHWINNRPTSCPRLYLEQEEDCGLCSWGFDLMRETKDKDQRSAIAKQWMPNESCFVNLYFPPIQLNPEELRGTIKFFNAPTSILQMWAECLERNDKGTDPEQPEAWGVFFDENEAFQFELVVTKKGRGNSYEKSHFVTKDGVPHPMIRDQQGNAIEKAIRGMLAQRIDPFTKIEVPNPEKIDKLFKMLVEGDDDEGGGFTEEGKADKASDKAEAKSDAKTADKAKNKAKTDKAKTEPAKAETPSEDDDTGVVPSFPDSDDDVLSNEAPLADDAEAEPASTPAGTATATADEDSDPDIQDLLSQLGDED